MGYRVIRDYYRQEHFDFFRDYQSPFYAVTFDVEITRLKAYLREKQYPTYLNLCYLLTRAAQESEDFRYRLVEEQIVLYDVVHPGLTVPAPGGRYSFAYYRYEPDIDDFNRGAAAADAERQQGVNLHEQGDRAWLYFSALPWVSFTGLTHATRNPLDVEPRISFGKFRESDGGLYVPVGLQVNHLFIDGPAVGRLVERVGEEYADPG